MALLARRSALLRHLPSAVDGCQPGILVICGGSVKVPVATLQATYGQKYDYPEPYPYWKKSFNLWARGFDYTSTRFNENTKMIVVEGNIGVGKTEFAKRIAKQFDLKFFPPTIEKQCFLHKEYGFDMRKLDACLPESARLYDLAKFYADPHPERGTVGRLQLLWYREKFFDYFQALKHLLSTGQGVVMTGSAFSDVVYVDALRSMGWLTDNFVKYYNTVWRDNTICELHHPHLTIYLDAPVHVLRQRINTRNEPHEAGSRNLTDDYLKAIEHFYHQRFLPKMRKKAEVVEIDWTEVASQADVEMIAEELSLLKLEGEDNDDPRFSDWARKNDDDWMHLRILCEQLLEQHAFFHLREPWECPEVMYSADDRALHSAMQKDHPLFQYQPGWAPEFGHRPLLKFW